MNTPLVSIVVPVYNESGLLVECLESAISQTIRNIEIIVIDDASTDDTRTYIEKFATRDSRIVALSHPTNKGRGESRNTGIDAAKGKYLFFLDSDDSLPSNSLQVLVSVAESRDSQLVYGKARSKVDVDRTYIKCDLFNISAKNYPDILHNHSVWNKLIRRDVLLESGIRFVPPKYAEDILFSLKLNMFCHAITIVNTITYNYRWGRQVQFATKQKLLDAQSNNISAYRLVKDSNDEILLEFMREKAAKNIYRSMRRAERAFGHADLVKYVCGWDQVVSDIPDHIISNLIEPNRVYLNLVKEKDYEAAIRYWKKPRKFGFVRKLTGS